GRSLDRRSAAGNRGDQPSLASRQEARSRVSMSRDNSESNVISNFRRVFKVEDVSIDLLKPHPNRARVHSRAQIRKIQLGIRAYGIMKPILVGPTMIIISGHAVVEAAKREGYKELPV